MSRKRREKPGASVSPSETDPFYSVQQAASMTECTGILPAQPETPEERRNIAALGAIHPEENDRA